MAASQADIDLTVRALNGLSTAARAEFVRVWSSLDLANPAAVQRVLMRFWPELIAQYGELAAALAGDVFELQADDLGISTRTELVRPVDVDRANARARWALTTADALGNFLVLLDELVKQPYRSSFARSAEASGAGWARVPRGSETCAFCLMLGSRGAVYRTSKTAGRLRKFHGDCVVPGTVVSGPHAVAATSRIYEGEVVTLTAGVHKLTVTPNHPILTARGWVAAQFVNEFDYLVSAESVERVIGSGPDVHDGPAFIEDRFRSLAVMLDAVRHRMPGSTEQFHGDGGRSKVDVVMRNDLFWGETHSLLVEHSTEFDLAEGTTVGAVGRRSFDGESPLELRSVGLYGAADGGVSGSGLGLALCGRHLASAGQSGVAVASSRNAGFSKPPSDNSSGYTVSLGKGVLTFPGEVLAHDIIRSLDSVSTAAPVVAVERGSYVGHVYNLSTDTGWYLANGIVSHNCDCAIVLVRDERDYPEGYDPDDLYQRYLDAR